MPRFRGKTDTAADSQKKATTIRTRPDRGFNRLHLYHYSATHGTTVPQFKLATRKILIWWRIRKDYSRLSSHAWPDLAFARYLNDRYNTTTSQSSIYESQDNALGGAHQRPL
jgi:hypothetical protein